jgi:glucosamine--fructose-6-phosphate aminotransferase (isomerizing)
MTLGIPGELTAADLEQQPDVLSQVLAINTDALARARRFLEGSSLVRLVGIGSSKHAAGFGAHAFEQFTEVPAMVLPAPGAAIPLPRLGGDHLVIILSQSGLTPAILHTAERTLEKGSRVIAITNSSGSPLHSIADVTLECSAGPEAVVPATKSVTAQMLLLLAMARRISEEELQELVASVRRVIVSMDPTPGLAGLPPGRVVCAGFAAEWIADEIALKFAEMAGLSVTSEPLIEYFHGPVGAAAPTLAFLDLEDPNTRGLVAGDQVVTVGAASSFDVVIPEASDPEFEAIVRLVAGQRMALEWAKRLGQDPDADRGLKKVTPTR